MECSNSLARYNPGSYNIFNTYNLIMTQIEISTKNFNKLVTTLNHRVTKIEVNIKWIKRVIYYMALLGTASLGILGRIAFT